MNDDDKESKFQITKMSLKIKVIKAILNLIQVFHFYFSLFSITLIYVKSISILNNNKKKYNFGIFFSGVSFYFHANAEYGGSPSRGFFSAA